MINRWFHRAKLHSPEPGKERKVGWLELFYDLIYVATFIQMGNALSENISLMGFLGFAGLMAPIWFTWTTFTFYNNRFVIDDAAHRALVFGQMFGVGGMAVSVRSVFTGDPVPFVLSFLLARVFMVAMYWRAARHVPQTAEMSHRYWAGGVIGGAVWGASLLAPMPWVYLIWAIAFLVDLWVPLNRKSQEMAARFPADGLLASERYGLLTLIVLGESFVKVLTALSDKGPHPQYLAMGALALLITCALWWIYFDDVAGSRVKRIRLAPQIWIYGHLPLTIAVTAVGVAIYKAALLDPFGAGGDKYRWLLCGTLSMVLLSVALIDSVTERRQAELSDKSRVRIRLLGAGVVLLLAPAGEFMPAWAFVLMVAGCCVVQVLLDLSFAPIGFDEHDLHHEDPAMGIRRADAQPMAQPVARKRPALEDAIRKGAPAELRRDLYFHLMEGSWTRIFSWVVGLFFLTNLIFAALYLLEPAGVHGLSTATFLEAFSFSVQTMATIGYGTMHPDSPYSHSLMSIEALVGLLGVALITGVVFAKAARPTASVLFNNYPVLTMRHGVPTLMFRTGNARGNDVVDAQLKVAVLKDEISSEGHTMRKLHDLTLERSNTPVFALSWAVMHVVDENSPFYGITRENKHEFFGAMIAIITGHDSTYAQTIHARHMYYPEDLRIGHRLVDVISSLDDGRLVVDYNLFHETEPDGSAEAFDHWEGRD